MPSRLTLGALGAPLRRDLIDGSVEVGSLIRHSQQARQTDRPTS
jgi:hypothetical protein